MKKRNEDDPDNLDGLGGMLPAEVLKMLNELLERLHQLGNETMKESKNERKIVVNIYKPGSLHVDHVDNQNFYGDKWAKALQGKEPAENLQPPDLSFDDSTPLSALFRKNHYEELRKVIDFWRPYLINDDQNMDALAMTRFEFDKDKIYSNKVYRDLCELDALGALQVPMSQLARYLSAHSNLSRSYATLYQQLKYYRSECE